VSHIIKKRSINTITSTPEQKTSAEGEDVVIHLEQADIDAGKKKMSKQSLRTLLGELSKKNKLLICLNCR
jgi:hypothetical protein